MKKLMMSISSAITLAVTHPAAIRAQQFFDHICPSFWWTGMKWSRVQILFHAEENLQQAQVSTRYPGVKILQVHHVENPHYLFVDLQIEPDAKPGDIPLLFKITERRHLVYPYHLYPRNPDDGKTRALGVNSRDFIYLLMPDRFANGDTLNDRVAGMLDQSLNRDSLTARHGGDLQGVIDHLDYLKDLGVTAIWMTPVLENNEAHASYHGYAFTDHYRVDPRLGTNALYKKLVEQAHQMGLKVIQDIVLNHVGEQHWFVRDLPMKDWLHQWPRYTNTSYRESPLFDPYASSSDKKQMSDGWFTPFMPDLNQRNPYLVNYLIQNAIWWVEYAGVDAFRIDTYIYCDLNFMNQFNAALLREFPHLHLFGETWVHGVLPQAYFVRNKLNMPFQSNLPGVCDFQWCFAVQHAFTEKNGWTSGIVEPYLTLAQDFVYQDPMKNVIFLDNHDMSRIYSVVGQDIHKFESAFTLLLTSRGIPQMYYGDEILMKGISAPDGLVRKDFPGGWPGDTVNKFSDAGRTETENIAFHFIQNLAHFRQQSEALREGKLMQYVPEGNVYVYFRYTAHESIMVAINGNDDTVSVSTNRFAESLHGYKKAFDVLHHQMIEDISRFHLPPYGSLVWQLKP
ncbi:glycoside hydrolase family 13 protein [Thermoflavifilum sp.]|uniref:glycoside hydrolase family 13 protein n=1 Tax=Thermoflavifilum sp. TaxID=1968839 RepID=UPI0025FF2ACA|nr:glycoside hydrolase family 13 protein [Thermoflavifilum sp.]